MKILFISLLLSLIGANTCLASETNRIYLDQNVPDAARVTNAPDTKPDSEDPYGNWGQVLNGAQLSIRFEKNSYTNGEPVVATAICRNVSDELLGYGSFTFQIRDASGRLVETIKEKNAKNQFEKNLARISIGHGASYVSPSKQIKCQSRLDDVWDVAKPGKYTIVFCATTFKAFSGTIPDRKSFSTEEEFRAAKENLVRAEQKKFDSPKSGTAHIEIK